SNRPGAVFGTHDEHAENPDDQLTEEQTGQTDTRRVEAELVRQRQRVPRIRRGRTGDGGDANSHDDHGHQCPNRRAYGAHLDPFGSEHAAHSNVGARRWRRKGGEESHGLYFLEEGDSVRLTTGSEVLTPRYSTLSRVSSIKASSSDANCGESSWRQMPWAPAT